jgi:GNAT superfamily N-acetyltransferase
MEIARLRRKHFPVETESGFTIRDASEKEFERVVESRYDQVFVEHEGSLHFRARGARREKMKPMIRRYAALHHERFLIVDADGKPVGWHMGEAEDAVSYYMRNTALLPEYQGRGLYGALLDALTGYLGELGYERITSLHKPTNRRILTMKLKRGFDICGIELTENWGALVKMVKILAPDRKASFYRQFGMPGHEK